MKVTLAAGSVEEGDPDSSTIPLFNYRNMEKALSELIPELWQDASLYQEIEISLRFVNKAEMASLNMEYRGVSSPTDVISFSLWEGEELPHPLRGVAALGVEARNRHREGRQGADRLLGQADQAGAGSLRPAQEPKLRPHPDNQLRLRDREGVGWYIRGRNSERARREDLLPVQEAR